MLVFDYQAIAGSLGIGFNRVDGVPTEKLYVKAGNVKIEAAYKYLIGDDCELYRNAADVLRTPDSFMLDGKLTVANSNASIADGTSLTKTFGVSLNAEKSSLLVNANFNAIESTGSALMQALRINCNVNYTAANTTPVYPLVSYSTISGSGGVTPSLAPVFSGGTILTGHSVTTLTQYLAASMTGAGSVGTLTCFDAFNPTVSATTVYGVRSRIASGSQRYNLYVDGTAPSLFAAQIQSTLATGTAPFSIASTTMVNNLNVQYLNGQAGSYYAVAANVLPLSGGSLSGSLTLNTGNLTLNSQNFPGLIWYPGSAQTGDATDYWLFEAPSISGAQLRLYHRDTSTASWDIQYLFKNDSLYINAYKVWHEGNDGHTSTLDADTVDGSHASDFATASHTHSFVSSVGLSAPGIFTVTGSPVTSSGTLTFSLNTQSPNLVFAGPSSGGSASPTFRSLVAADIPNLSAAILTSGTLPNGRLGGSYTGITGISVDDLTVTNVLEVQNYLQALGSDNALAAIASTAGTVWHPVFENDPSVSAGVIRYKTGAQLNTAIGVPDTNARVAVRKDSAGSIYVRRRINFIQGGGCTITISDDAGNEEIDITISVP